MLEKWSITRESILAMRVLPAIDLFEGQVVRLTQGDFAQKNTYPLSPLQAALHWKRLGFTFLHVISLDGARDGAFRYPDLLRTMAEANIHFQFGGGIRTCEQIQQALDAGAQRVILGTSAITSTAFWNKAVERFTAQRLVLALDIQDGFVATHGWLRTSPWHPEDVIDHLGETSILHLLVTDIQRDGCLQGANSKPYEKLRKRFPLINIIPAGGVSIPQDLLALDALGIQEVVVGKALYETPTFIDVIRKHEYL